MNENELIHLAQQGDHAAYEVLVTTHQEAVFRLAYLLLGDPDDAKDIAQDAFIQAYKSLNRFDAERPLRPWLLRIVSNLASNRRRSMARYMAALRRFVSTSDDSPAAVMLQQDQETLWQAVRQLSHDDQEIIYLRYFLELSSQETAAALNIAEGTVRSRLHRALGRLRTLIEHDIPELQEGGSV